MRIGAHVSVSGGVEKAIGREEDVGGNCGQIFAGSPRTWTVAEYDEGEADGFREAREEASHEPYVIHSTYLVNLATPKDELMEKSVSCLQKELNAARDLGVEYVVFHPGAHTGSGVENGLDSIADGVDALEIPDGVTLLFENTAGKGTTLGKEFSQLREMLDRTQTPDDDLGVCIDTCHAHAAGYDLADDFDGVVEELDSDLGLEHVEVLHLNDSKDPLGSEKDNHEHIGEGGIGNEGFENVVNADELADLPMVLETPTSDGKSYAENIERIRSLVS
jgi:deoxyribonuclease-4